MKPEHLKEHQKNVLAGIEQVIINWLNEEMGNRVTSNNSTALTGKLKPVFDKADINLEQIINPPKEEEKK